MNRREFLHAGVVAAAAGVVHLSDVNFVLASTDNVGPEGPIRLRTDGPTVLMGFRAELTGNLKQFPGWPKVMFPGNAEAAKQLQRDRTKWLKYSDSHWWVEEWKSPEDAFIWNVEVPEAGYYNVHVIGTGRESVVEVAAADSKITAFINNGLDVMWDASHFPPEHGQWRCDFGPPDDYFRFVWSAWARMPLGSILLPAGKQTVRVTAPKPGTDLALYSLELVPTGVEERLVRKAEKLRSSTAWMADAKYGLFFHWTSSKTNSASATYPPHGLNKLFPANVESFDADAFAKMVSGTGAGYIIFTSTWAEHSFPAPIQAIDRVLPGRTSKRDLLMQIADALAKHGVRMMLYYHLGVSDPEWWKATKDNFVENWCAITREVGERYREKLAGWWFDGGEAYYTMNAPFDRLAESAKAGHPGRVIAYNNGNFWPKFTDFQDFVGAEGPHYWVDDSLNRYLPAGGSGIYTGGRQAGLQAHQCFPLESPGWVHNRRDSPISSPIWNEVSLIPRMKDADSRNFVPTLALEVYEDGSASEQTLRLLEAVRKAIKG